MSSGWTTAYLESASDDGIRTREAGSERARPPAVRQADAATRASGHDPRLQNRLEVDVRASGVKALCDRDHRIEERPYGGAARGSGAAAPAPATRTACYSYRSLLVMHAPAENVRRALLAELLERRGEGEKRRPRPVKIVDLEAAGDGVAPAPVAADVDARMSRRKRTVRRPLRTFVDLSPERLPGNKRELSSTFHHRPCAGSPRLDPDPHRVGSRLRRREGTDGHGLRSVEDVTAPVEEEDVPGAETGRGRADALGSDELERPWSRRRCSGRSRGRAESRTARCTWRSRASTGRRSSSSPSH